MLEPQVAAAPTRTPAKSQMTFEEFLDWCDEDTHAEWVNGEIVMTSLASAQHQDIKRFLFVLLRQFVRRNKLGKVLDAPVLMRLPHVPSGREPDILFVRAENTNRLRDTYLDGPADLVVEIISPESIARDRGDKFVEYEQAGIPEYWLIDPIRRRAEFYVLNATGMYELINPDPRGIFQSRVVDGFWLRVEWLWQDPLPLEEDLLAEIRKRA
ncbi:MAG: Uma2 family endonuclease [Chloroflexi bacterium]|nr:Uma2 family endonuclease [Chloroflexota bacterium]